MKQTFLILLFLFIYSSGKTQDVSIKPNKSKTENIEKSYQKGEWLKFRIHYGFVNAGYATLELKQSKRRGKSLYHAVGHGWTVGAASLFFKITDNYESHFTKNKVEPVKFKRRVDEGGYIIRRDLSFDHSKNKVIINDLEKNKQTEMYIGEVQDMVSAFYHLRNYDLRKIKKGDEIQINLFFDNETYPFRLKFLEKEIVNTEFGKVKTWKIRPIVQKGRVFREQESLTLWITDDKNKIPIRIKASLAVGSLKADLQEFKGLANLFNMIKE